MRNISKFEGKLIRMNKSYPIHNDDDEIVGYTEVGDMAVITFAEIKKKTGYKTVTKISDELSIGIPVITDGEEGYFETIIVSGKYTGIDSLALDLEDIATSTFIFNKVDGDDIVYIQDRKINFEYVWFVDEFLVSSGGIKMNLAEIREKAISILASIQKDFQHALDDGEFENADEDSKDAVDSNRECIEDLDLAIKALSR